MIDSRGLGLLGMGAKAGSTVVGTAGVRAALQRDELALVVLASNCSRRTDEKVGRLARGKGVPTTVGPTATDLGRSLGRSSVQAVGIRDRHLARGIEAVTVMDGRRS